VDFKRRIAEPLELAVGGYISVLDAGGGWSQIAAKGAQQKFHWEAEGSGATWEGQNVGRVCRLGETKTPQSYFLRQRTPSLVISTSSPADVSSVRIASEAWKLRALRAASISPIFVSISASGRLCAPTASSSS
jgi:hypothetical protein